VDEVKRTRGKAGAAAGTEPAPPSTIVFFGGGGDLVKRLLMPALYNLAGGGLLDPRTRFIGVDHVPQTTAQWRAGLTATMRSFARDSSGEFHVRALDRRAWGWVARRLSYLAADFDDPGSYAKLAALLEAGGGERKGNVVFYLAVAARFFGPIVDRLGAAGLLHEAGGAFRRVIIEKPFGSDLPSAEALNRRILQVMSEQQIYRVDHFLGKETVQNIMALRFGNGIYEPIWNRRYVEHVQITAAETIGVELRGAFYEATGALRDMVPNHLFQLLTMMAMEPPVTFAAEAVRNEKAKLVGAISPIQLRNVVRGQYRAGRIGAQRVRGYRQEPDVARRSRTETYVALKLEIQNWRWAGVPFYLRTGKRLGNRRTEVAVHFKAAPYRLFQGTPTEELGANVLRLQCDPDHAIETRFNAKVPGPAMRLAPVATTFRYADYFTERPNVGYETLFYDCLRGDPLLFQRADAIEAGWAAVEPVLRGWQRGRSVPAGYAAGSDGPAEADQLLARAGHQWLPLTEPLRPGRID
jgi:glucose-6-phosphate 1-dehydrogenase